MVLGEGGWNVQRSSVQIMRKWLRRRIGCCSDQAPRQHQMTETGAESSDRHGGAAVPAALRQSGRTRAGETPAPPMRNHHSRTCSAKPRRDGGAAVPAAPRQFGRTRAGETPAPQFRAAVPDSCKQQPLPLHLLLALITAWTHDAAGSEGEDGWNVQRSNVSTFERSNGGGRPPFRL
jgi:hypothetical protein